MNSENLMNTPSAIAPTIMACQNLNKRLRNMPSVYISVRVAGNGNKDGEVARKIKNTIEISEQNEHTCLGLGMSLEIGQPELEVLRQEIDPCEFVVCIFSKDYFEDSLRWVELMIGLEKTTSTGYMRLVVVLMEDVTEEDIPNTQLLRKQQDRFIRVKDTPDYDQRVLSRIKENYNIKHMLPAGNVAHGQAWSHFTGYLSYILPRVEGEIKNSSWYKENPGRMSTKFFEMVPLSAKCPDMIDGIGAEYKDKITLVKDIMRGGTPRTYEVTVWSVKDDAGKEYYFTGDYPSVVKAMYSFRHLMEGDLECQVRRFGYALREIISHKNNSQCHNKHRMLCYDDTKGVSDLRSALIDQIKKDAGNEEELTEDFKTKMLLGEQESYDHDVSFLTGESENSNLVEEIYRKLNEDDRFRCIPPSQPTVLKHVEEMTKTKYTLLFLSKRTLSGDVNFLLYKCALMSEKLKIGAVNIVPVLVDVEVSMIPSYLQWLTYVDCKKDKDLLERIQRFLVGPDQEIHYALPVGHVYIGLVCGYYYNYLSFMLKAFEDSPISQASKKFHIVIPKSCKTHKDFSFDERISLVEKRMIAIRNEAGEVGRKYQAQIYKLEDANQTYYFVGQYATPILALNEMMTGKIAGLSRQEMENQRCKFVQLLEEKLNASDLKDYYCLIDYDDTRDPADLSETKLSEELLKNLRN